jgi:ABC-type sugar transport system ATPase subunit
LQLDSTKPGGALTVDGLSLSIDGKSILDDVTLEIPEGQRIGIIGPSGSGKTSLLRCISGLEGRFVGKVTAHGRRIQRASDYGGTLGFVFQDLGLFENSSVMANVLLGHKSRELLTNTEEICKSLAIDHLLHSSVNVLSGGERQRVAIARCLIRTPKFMLLDEPFANLDLEIMLELERVLLRAQSEHGFSLVYVTHNQSSATRLCDSLIMISGGRILQTGSFRDLYFRPANASVMNFMSEWPINTFDCHMWGVQGSHSKCFVRPEKMKIVLGTQSSESLPHQANMVCVRRVQSIPVDYLVFLSVDNVQVICADYHNAAIREGEGARVGFAPEDIIFVDH